MLSMIIISFFHYLRSPVFLMSLWIYILIFILCNTSSKLCQHGVLVHANSFLNDWGTGSIPVVGLTLTELFSRTTEPISTKLGTKHPWVKRIQVCSNEEPLILMKIAFSSLNHRYEITICVYWFELFSQVSDVASCFSNEGSSPSQGADNCTIVK